jgi:hypothetical protein
MHAVNVLPIRFRDPTFFKWSVDIFVSIFPFTSYSTFLFGHDDDIEAEVLGFWVDCRSFAVMDINDTPEKAHSCVELRRLSHHACFCDCEKKISKNIC